jgi:hypothetical protein
LLFQIHSFNIYDSYDDFCSFSPTGAQRTEENIQAQALPQEIIDRIGSSVLCVSNSDGDVIATAIVWDYTDTDVLLLTNYRTWDSSDFRYCFPPVKKISKGKRKKTMNRWWSSSTTTRISPTS